MKIVGESTKIITAHSPVEDDQVTRRPIRKLGVLSLVILAFSLPFELETALFEVEPIRLTNIEIHLALSLALGLLIVIGERRWRIKGWIRVPRSWLWLWLVYTAGLFLAAYLAPEFRLNAFKALARSVSGLALAAMVPQLVRNRRDFHWTVAALLVGGMVSAMIGLAEIASGGAFAWLGLFRNQATVVGPFARLSATFNHANQVAMFIEATLPLLVAGAWLALRRGRHWIARIAIVAGLLYVEASILTYSRSSFVTIFVANLLVAGLVWWSRPKNRRKLAYPWMVIAGITLLLVAANTYLSPVLRLRLSSEGDNEWYSLKFTAPKRMIVTTGETTLVTVSAANEGAIVWSSSARRPIGIGGRWYENSGQLASSAEFRWPLASDVMPGEGITMTVPLRAPEVPGQYIFQWDLVQEEVVWFANKNGLVTVSSVEVRDYHMLAPSTTHGGNLVSRALGAKPVSYFIADGISEDASVDVEEWASKGGVAPGQTVGPIPDRRTLWRVAWHQFSKSPFHGIGLDNFRLTYGKFLGLSTWNDSIHTNNWYVETIVSLGLPGAIAFFAWLAMLLIDIGRTLLNRSATGPGSDGTTLGSALIWQMALAAGLLAFVVHGILDYFLMFHGTAMLFWLLVGLWVAQKSFDRTPSRSRMLVSFEK